MVWYALGKNKEQEYWLDWLAGKKYTLVVVLGNHENYNIIERLPIEEKWGNQVRVLERCNGCIYFLKRGGVYDYVLTHTCPTKFVNRFTSNMIKAKCSVANFLEYINDVVECTEWHFGHFHKDKALHDGKYRCHYESPPFELGVDGKISIVKEA